MHLGLQSLHRTDVAIFATRINDTRAERLPAHHDLVCDVDFSDPQAVAQARADILRMCIWDDFIKNAIHIGREEEARQAIADTVLRLKAAMWEKGFFCKVLAEGLEPEDLLAAQARFLSLLSPQGVRVMTSRYQVVAEGIRYTPDTGNTNVDAMLRMVVTEELIGVLRKLEPIAGEVADTLAEHALAWRMAEPSRAEAQYWEGVGWAAELEQNHHGGAIAMEKAASAWEVADQSKVAAAHAWRCAAGHLRDAGEFHRAAQLFASAAKIYGAADLHGQAATAYRAAAWSWDAAGERASAARTQEMEAEAWQIADQSKLAEADAWHSAGWRWATAGQDARAAQLLERAASIYEAVGKPDRTAAAYEHAATRWNEAGQGACEASDWAKAAMAWERVHDYRKAAECWTGAGSPGLAARAWKQAIDRAGEETTAAQDVSTQASPLFRFEMEFENTLNG